VRASAGLLACLAALGACTPKAAPPPPAPAFTLDCAKGYGALAADLAASPALKLTTETGEPYLYYNQKEGGGPSYVVTQVGAPGHPAVIKQEAVQIEGKKSMMTAGCPYGDPQGYARLLAYLQGLKDAALAPTPEK
jgi:hypothetical protein